jgi:hypothetical protein
MRAALLLCLSLAACATTKQSATPPSLPDRYAKCSIQKSQSRPLIVEWPSTDRASLESLSKRGLVAVRYTGCEMEVLTRCKVKGEYKYTPVTLQSERITIDDADELYANIPVGAAKLEGELEKSGQLNVDTSIVGTYDSGESVARDDLDGDCGRATHVLTSLTVGAFEFYSGAAVSGGGGVVAFGVGAGGKTRSQQTLLSRSGSGDACKSATGSDERPPEGCGALLRVEATPIAAARAKAAPPPEIAPPPETPPPETTPGETPNVETPGAEETPAAAATAPPETLPSSGPAASDPVAIQDSIGPPPPRGDLVFGPGFVLGLRGPFAFNFGELEEGVQLWHYSPISAGFVLEIGARLGPMFSVVGTGSITGGSSSSSSDECPSGLKCRALLLGAGADLVVTPRGDERLWLGLGAEYSYIRMTREGEYDDGAHTLDTERHYGGIGPRVSIGTDFADPYVSWIQYGFMVGYTLRFGLSASGKNQRDGVDEPMSGKPGINHTILFLGRFHFDAGVQRGDSKS